MITVAIDPGKANGWATFKDGKLDKSGVATQKELYGILENTEKLECVVFESYKLYASHSRQMIGDAFLTSQIIGVIKYISEKRNVPFFEQPATFKAFFDDKRLKEMGLYVPIDHRRDAIRHGLYFFQFGKGKGKCR